MLTILVKSKHVLTVQSGGNIMNKEKILLRVSITFLFLLSLCFVEAGFCGSSVVAEYNNGFGTLDMKNYAISDVRAALGGLNNKGIQIYKMYYVMDFLFVFFFGVFQTVMTCDLYAFMNGKRIRAIIIGISVLRGLCDGVENSILLRTLFTFPEINEKAIAVSALFTQIKLWCVVGWILLCIVGVICRIGNRIVKW